MLTINVTQLFRTGRTEYSKEQQYDYQEVGHQDSGMILLLTLPLLK